MVGVFFSRLTELLEDGFEDAMIVAEGVLIMTVASSPDDENEMLTHAKTDMSDAITKAARRVSERRRKTLEGTLRAAPHVIAGRGPGRKPKTIFELKREALEYAVDVEAAYRAQRLVAGEPPTKTSVAAALHEGGVNFKSGGDSGLNTFNLKLSRLGISYDEIAAKVEAELHKNPD